jgi:hypothetical protein
MLGQPDDVTLRRRVLLDNAFSDGLERASVSPADNSTPSPNPMRVDWVCVWRHVRRRAP